MAKKYISKALSVGLALAMCASMAAPAFAASFSDLSNAVYGGGYKGFYTTDSGTRYGYGESMGENKWEIEAWDDGETRNVQLNNSVGYQEKDGSRSDLTINGGKKVVLDLNGQTVDNSDFVNSTAAKEAGKGPNSSTLYVVNGSLTVKDSSGNNSGKVTGARQSGVWVEKDGRFILEGGTITGNTNVNGGEAAGGGGVRVNGGIFTMNGGKITGNSASANGGGVTVYQGTFIMNGGEISGNQSNWGSGIAVIGEGSSFTMTGSAVLKDNNGYTPAKSSDIFVKNGGSVSTKDNTATGDGMIFTGFEQVKKTTNEKTDAKDWETKCGSTCVTEGNDINGDKGYFLTSVYGEAPSDPNEDNSDEDNPGEGGSDETNPSQVVVIGEPDVPLADLPEVEVIEDEAVPLAGLFTRADAIGYLWQQSGSPEAGLSDFADVPEDHQWAVAIGWAQEMGISVADGEGNFRPDDLVLRSTGDVEGELQELLNRYAVFAGVEPADGELFIELDGGADDVIMGEEAQEIFDAFFAQLEATLAAKAA